MGPGLLRAAVAIAIAAVCFAAGLVHVVRGHKVRIWPGIAICNKRQWTLRNTFINTDDYVNQPKLVAELDDNVILALGDCGLFYRAPEIHPEDEDPDSTRI
ncbi:MAG TPA: hypothetical protein VHZ53_00020 [Steroidobacteraceae bacterium]|jgi:hypothetical protein|nr:hypothetical protein [Steroidobacteraceae bacterium]